VPAAIDPTGGEAEYVRAIAPVLYLHRNERFQLTRAVAVIHPARRVIAYHLLWRDDVHGAWIPFTKPTDQEIVWVGYDSTGAPTDVWTYWHGAILHSDWRGRGTVLIDVQWGKHGSLPHGARLEDLPWLRSLPVYWLATWVGLPDLWLGRANRRGPACFCLGYGSYRDFSRPLLLGPELDVIVRAEDPSPALSSVFGRPYSEKVNWPW
jgi:hypothetical protein